MYVQSLRTFSKENPSQVSRFVADIRLSPPETRALIAMNTATLGGCGYVRPKPAHIAGKQVGNAALNAAHAC